MVPPAMGMMPSGMGMTPPGMGMTPPGIGITSWHDAIKHGARDEHGHGARIGFWHEHDARDEHGHDSSHGFGIRHGHDASGLWWHGDGRLGRPGDAWPDELFWWW